MVLEILICNVVCAIIDIVVLESSKCARKLCIGVYFFNIARLYYQQVVDVFGNGSSAAYLYITGNVVVADVNIVHGNGNKRTKMNSIVFI